MWSHLLPGACAPVGRSGHQRACFVVTVRGGSSAEYFGTTTGAPEPAPGSTCAARAVLVAAALLIQCRRIRQCLRRSPHRSPVQLGCADRCLAASVVSSIHADLTRAAAGAFAGYGDPSELDDRPLRHDSGRPAVAGRQRRRYSVSHLNGCRERGARSPTRSSCPPAPGTSRTRTLRTSASRQLPVRARPRRALRRRGDGHDHRRGRNGAAEPLVCRTRLRQWPMRVTVGRSSPGDPLTGGATAACGNWSTA